MIRTPLPAPLLRPGTGRLPVLLSVPHAGTDYPGWLLRESRRGRSALEPLEDPLVDRLIWRAAGLGLAAVVARTPRAAIDCNRALSEIDPGSMTLAPGSDPGPRARGGLGLVPSRTPREGQLWRSTRLPEAELARRVAEAWRPYHRLIADELSSLQRIHGEVLLLDMHSMPPQGGPQLVIGDRHGRSAGRWLADLARQTAEDAGFRTALNEPYAGGEVVAQHGCPAGGIHALQLEVDRSCYLAGNLRSPCDGFDRTARLLEQLAGTLGQALLDRNNLPQAAE